MISVAALRPRAVVGAIGHLTNFTVVSFPRKELSYNPGGVFPIWEYKARGSEQAPLFRTEALIAQLLGILWDESPQLCPSSGTALSCSKLLHSKLYPGSIASQWGITKAKAPYLNPRHLKRPSQLDRSTWVCLRALLHPHCSSTSLGSQSGFPVPIRSVILVTRREAWMGR